MNYGTVNSQPTAGQFPGQQSGTTNAFPGPQSHKASKTGGAGGPAPQQGAGGSSRVPEGDNPPTYADVIKGDHKVQKP